ncbi:CLUMA_CG006456, isoform A [Clunio marinus]|uniref:CLUMA_CG006456, isoform A n=1 Tax=Clunio marinus TaxID=568069 RepID=A0A1J1HXR8_9DIPT|nr:CLUMA_CG006456, isoform A [Clunio marinus]
MSSNSSKILDVSFLYCYGYKFGKKVTQNSLSKVKNGDKILACKIIKNKLENKKLNECMEALKPILHPYIVTIHSIVQNGKFSFIFMQWYDGFTLLEYLQQHGMADEVTAKLWFFQSLSAIEYLHKLGFAYCNLKCDCVMLERNNVKISGLRHMRKWEEGRKVEIKARKSILPFYNPPEVNLGRACDPRKVDIFTLGTILFMMLNGMPPFNNSNISQLVDDQINQRFQFRASNIRTLSVECQVMVYTLLEPNHDFRWNVEKIIQMKWLSKYGHKQGDS